MSGLFYNPFDPNRPQQPQFPVTVGQPDPTAQAPEQTGRRQPSAWYKRLLDAAQAAQESNPQSRESKGLLDYALDASKIAAMFL